MSLDTGLLAQARTAEARVIDAEHAAEVARADFHRAVRRLQLAGGSLREIADALGLSHQRVHQIVESAGGSRGWRSRRAPGRPPGPCSFCGREYEHVETLIAGPGVFICDRCILAADAALAAGAEGSGPRGTGTGGGGAAGALQPVGADARAERCSFCGKRRHQVTGMATAAGARICDECLGLCHEIRDEQLA